MGFRDLREFIAGVQNSGELRVVRGADCNLEIGAITEVSAESPGCPMLLFDRIEGLEPGYRLVTNLLHTTRRLALALGAPPDSTGIELVKKWKEGAARMGKALPPVVVPKGSIQENVLEGDDVDLFKFPGVKWHEFDSARYFAGPAVIMRDPEEGWVNIGVYRLQIIDRKTVLLSIAPRKHGRTILSKYWRRGESCPVAVSMGNIPALFMAGSLPVPWGVSEYDFAGHLNGAPIEVVLGSVTGLPIPASAEAVFEGEVPPVEVEGYEEGLWGEALGFYASELPVKHPVIKVKSVMHRNDPIIQGAPPFKPFPGMQHFPVTFGCAVVWNELERLGFRVRGVWQHAHSIMAISLRQAYAGHAKEAALAAASSRSSMSVRFIVTVDDDVDPSNLLEVTWAMGMCCDPERDIDVVKECAADRTDPIVWIKQTSGDDLTTGKVIINACKPVYRKGSFPRVNVLSPMWKARILEKWSQALK